VISTQLNFRIELIVSFLLLLTYTQLNLSLIEWTIVLLSLGFILFAELINTAIEVTCDMISIKYNFQIRNIKDIAAGAVLFCLFIVVGVNSIILFDHVGPLVNLKF